MKNSLRILLAAIPLTMMSMVSAVYASADIGGKTSGNTEPYPYISPTPGEFPIIGWGVDTVTNQAAFKDFVECGFNAAHFDIGKFKDIVQALNPVPGEDTIKLGMIIRCYWRVVSCNTDQMLDVMDDILNTYEQYAAPGNSSPVTSWLLLDEPKYYEFDGYKDFLHSMTRHDPKRMTWLNLIGDQKATDNFRPVETDTVNKLKLRDYIEAYCEKFHPGVLSYDYYPFNVDTLGVDRTIERGRLDDFYTALQLYSEISKKRNRPFWAFCQSRATCIKSDYSPHDGHPAPTENFLRYEAFNALAFGAQGIEYWNYREQYDPEGKSDPDAYYALVTKDGKKTDAWYFAKTVNQEIKNVSRIFLGAKLDSYYFVGDPRDTTYCDYKKGSMSDPIYVRSSRVAQNGAGTNLGALVSTLTNGDKHYVVVMNQSPYEKAYLNLSFNNPQYVITQIMTVESADLSSNTSSTDGIGLGRVNKSVSLKPSKYQIYQFKPRTNTQNSTEQQ